MWCGLKKVRKKKKIKEGMGGRVLLPPLSGASVRAVWELVEKAQDGDPDQDAHHHGGHHYSGGP